MLNSLRGKNIHIVGISGAEGSAVALFLTKKIKATFSFHDFCQERDFKKSFFSFHDAYTEEEKEERYQEIMKYNSGMKFGDHYLEGIDEADVIFVPQSWFRYLFNEPLKKYRKKLTSITRLYLEIAKSRVVGVTGTAGKSTTTAIIYQIIKAAGQSVIIAGNERHVKQQLDEVLDLGEEDYLVLEISNRQLLLGLEKSPSIAVITNIFPNHLDDHDSLEDYIKVKKIIFRNQNRDDIFVTNHDNKVTKKFKSKGTTSFFSRKEELREGAFIRKQEIVLKKDDREYKLCEIKDLKIQGSHNIENVLAASLTMFLAGIGTKYIRSAVSEFINLESRLELVREVGAVKFINDSKSCNPVATTAAIETFKRPIILIAGGTRSKIFEGEFEELAKKIIEKKIKAVILIGKTADMLERIIRKERLRHQAKTPLIRKQETLEKALSDAVALSESGDVVLFSPACESFGLFKDYRERAEKYKELVKKIR